MKGTLITNRFLQTINQWIEALDRYGPDQILIHPGPAQWSLGQVYMHLIEETSFFLQEAESCLAHLDNVQEEMNPEGKLLFKNNALPDSRIKRPVEFQVPEQPVSKAQLNDAMNELKLKLIATGKKISLHPVSGKSKHPGLNYFNATEWYQYAEMHMRHHLRQKDRLDVFLKNRTT